MRFNLAPVIWRLAVFLTVCAFGTFALIAVFGQLRFDKGVTYEAEFTNVSGLQSGNFVRIAGVEVGKVNAISIRRDGVVLVRFSVDPTAKLTESTRALIRYADTIGGRYLALEAGDGGLKPLAADATIPTSRTQPALNLDELLGGFRPLFRALDPQQVNALSGELIQAFQGQGATIDSFLAHTAVVTNTLGDRDELIDDVIRNLNVALKSLGDHNAQFDTTVHSLSQLIQGLAARKTDITEGISNADAAAQTLADLLSQTRAPFAKTVHETDRTAGIVVADHEYFDDLLNTLPDAYQILARQGMYGDYFNFYLCNMLLKVNGKGGQPVYIKMFGQQTGRCAPR